MAALPPAELRAVSTGGRGGRSWRLDHELDSAFAAADHAAPSDPSRAGGLDAAAERSDLEDSDDEDAGERDRPPDSGRVEGGAETRDASAPAPPSILFGSLESTMPLPEEDAFGPFPNRASGTAEAPKQHAWSAEQDHAVLVAAQTRGVSAATWESLAGAGGACRGATAEQVEARFAWLCDAAKKQKCASAARGGKPKGKPRKPKPRG